MPANGCYRRVVSGRDELKEYARHLLDATNPELQRALSRAIKRKNSIFAVCQFFVYHRLITATKTFPNYTWAH